MKQSPGRRFAAACIVAAGLSVVSAMLFLTLGKTNPAERDFIEYWAAEQQFAHGANPYDASAIFRIEKAAGLNRSQPEISFSPPVALFLALPLGYVSANSGLVAWSILLFVCLSASLWILWKLRGRPATLIHLFGYAFAPALVCIQAGQIGIFLLLGIVLFLYLHQTRPFVAGIVLLPCTLKPHLLLPFAIALLLWALSRRLYRILAGFLTAVLASGLLTLYLDRQVWTEYSQMMRTAGALDHYVPTLSATMRLLVAPHAAWEQFVPEAAACGWALWYFWTGRSKWNWMREGMLLLMVSVLCAPYAWFTDESVLLPAIFAGVFRAQESGRSLVPIVVIAGVALFEMQAVVEITSPFYLWTAPAWLAWYLYATGVGGTKVERIDAGGDELA